MESNRMYAEPKEAKNPRLSIEHALFPFSKSLNIDDKGSIEFVATVIRESKSESDTIEKMIKFTELKPVEKK